MMLRTEEINYLNELETVLHKYRTLRERTHLTGLEYFMDGLLWHITRVRKENAATITFR